MALKQWQSMGAKDLAGFQLDETAMTYHEDPATNRSALFSKQVVLSPANAIVCELVQKLLNELAVFEVPKPTWRTKHLPVAEHANKFVV